MIQSKIELKLLKIMELIHEQKVRLIEEKPVLYSSLADIHSRVELSMIVLRQVKAETLHPKV